MFHTPPIEMLPEHGRPSLLFILLHGADAGADSLLLLATTLRRHFPDAAFVLPEQFALPADESDTTGLTAVLDELAGFVRAQQDRFGTVNTDTALVGFAEGATLALELCTRQDGLVARVIAIAGRYLSPPEVAPVLTTIHLIHGEEDRVTPVLHAHEAFMQLTGLKGDATLDTASSVDHRLHPALIDCAVHRLQTCIPLRTWRRAMGTQQL